MNPKPFLSGAIVMDGLGCLSQSVRIMMGQAMASRMALTMSDKFRPVYLEVHYRTMLWELFDLAWLLVIFVLLIIAFVNLPKPKG